MISILITGGAGFVALHAAEVAIARGHRVRMMDVRRPEPQLASMISGSSFVEADVLDYEALRRAGEVDALIHCAAMVGPALGKAEPQRSIDVNVMGTTGMLELARRNKIRLVNMSTATLYGNRPELELLDEDSQTDPVSIYDATKLMGETLCSAYRKTFGVAASSIRTGFVYGFGSRIGQYFVPSALAGEAVRENVGGDHPCDFTYVVDLARALVDAAERDALPEAVYNVTGGTLRIRREFAHAVKSAIPDADIDAGAGVDPDRHLRGACAINRARRDFGYAPQFNIEQGVADWVRRAKAATSTFVEKAARGAHV